MIATAMIRPGCLGFPYKTKEPPPKSERDAGLSILTTRPPNIDDAVEVANHVNAVGTLESNSAYAYVLLCTHFADTCALAHSGGRLVGCALGYRMPSHPDTLFVWQVGVTEEFRRHGVGKRLLDELLRRPSLEDVHFLEMSIAPSNAASRRLFANWAEHHGFDMRETGGFAPVIFGGDAAHEAETIFRIGPLRDYS